MNPVLPADQRDLHESVEDNVFVMMRYHRHQRYREIWEVIRATLADYGLIARLAEERAQFTDVWENVKDYMRHCTYAIAVFEQIAEKEINPNIMLELGYVFGLERHCLLLIDGLMAKDIPADLKGKLYMEFDAHAIGETIAPALSDWCEKELRRRPVRPPSAPTLERQPTRDAETYDLRDLYASDAPERVPFYSVNDLVWDHQLLNFADHKGFFRRLGFDLDFQKYHPTKLNDYACVERLLDGEPKAKGLISCPRNFLSDRMKPQVSDLAVTNLFTGFGLIARQGLLEQFDRRNPRASFAGMVRALSRCAVKAEDFAGLEFLQALQELATRSSGYDIGLTFGLYRPGAGNIVDCLSASDGDRADVVVTTAPMRCLAMQRGYLAYFDHNDLVSLLDVIDVPEDVRRSVLGRTLIHNCWNINVAAEEWLAHRGTILRLASVALCTLQYINEHGGEVEQFIATEWENNPLTAHCHLDMRTMSETFRRSYYIVPHQKAFDMLLYRDSSFENDPVMRVLVQTLREQHNVSWTYNSPNVFAELLRLRLAYNEDVERLEQLKTRKDIPEDTAQRVDTLSERARRHSHIRNFYDAAAVVKQAVKIMVES